MSAIANIAAAVVSELNAGTFSQAFTSVRAYLPIYDLKDMTTLRVSVVPKAIIDGDASRGSSDERYQIDVAVQKKVDPADLSAVDALITLAEEIRTFFERRFLTALPTVHCVERANDPIYSSEHMNQYRQFTSLITLTFRTIS